MEANVLLDLSLPALDASTGWSVGEEVVEEMSKLVDDDVSVGWSWGWGAGVEETSLGGSVVAL